MGGQPRRQVLAAIVLAPAVLASGGCSLLRDDPPDPLLPLAAQARADAALAAAVLAAGVRAAQVEPVRAARQAHAAALEADIARRFAEGGDGLPAPPAVPAATIAALREALGVAREAAARAVLVLPVDRVGLVASVAACCGAYAELLT